MSETETEAARPDLDAIDARINAPFRSATDSDPVVIEWDFLQQLPALVAYCRRLEQEKADLLQMLAESTARAEAEKTRLIKTYREFWLAEQDYYDAHSPRRASGEAEAEWNRASAAWDEIIGPFSEWENPDGK